MPNRLVVSIEPGGYAQLCMVCPMNRIEPHDLLFVILVEWRRGGTCLRFCEEHLDELSILILEALS